MPLGRSISARKKINRTLPAEAETVSEPSAPPRLEIEIGKGGFIIKECDYSMGPDSPKYIEKDSQGVLDQVKSYLDKYASNAPADEADTSEKP